MKTIKKAFAALLAVMFMILSPVPATIFAEEPELKNRFSGKTVSILGDSISTYEGFSNNTAYNSTIGSNTIYYSDGRLGVELPDTWWRQTIDALDMKLLVNNSWSGSTVFYPRKGANSVGYRTRCVNLHNDRTGEEPDVIIVFIGTNDFSYYQSTLGTAEIDYDALIKTVDDGTYHYASPKTTCEAYAVMLHKMITRYPDAEIYCMTPTARRYPDKKDNYADVGQPTAFNAELTRIIRHFECTPVDLENCGIVKDAKIFDTYMGDGRVHPNPQGMDLITNALVSVMLGTPSTTSRIEYALSDVKCTTERASVLTGGSFTAALQTESDLKQEVKVTMGGKDITDTCYANGKINIARVTGDIKITARAVYPPADYRWKFEGKNAVSVGEQNNSLTAIEGTLSNGVLQNIRYRLEKPVLLRSDLPWAVEFRAGGKWSGMLLSAREKASTNGNTYLFKTNSDSGLIGLGERANEQYENYGVALEGLGVDTKASHTYRLENRIAADGTNSVFLFVDGTAYGEANHFFIGGTKDQNSSVNWAGGQDFEFSYIGADGHEIKNCRLEFLHVSECTHLYQGRLCSACGSADPNAPRSSVKSLPSRGVLRLR
ncbi:MAG: hypothetical protein E7654_05690 [Ruminococcaceae bacterium]|nr:hypothetical protein [Oscillospiraceae bacterium]